MTRAPIRVFLADDHALVRLGLRQLLEREPDVTVVGEADDGRRVLLADGKDGWDVLVLDVSLPKVGGIEANNFSGSIGLTWPVAEGASVAFNAARAFRAPSVEELFSNAFHAALGSYDIGNPGLVPEVARDVRRVECVKGKGIQLVYLAVVPGAILEFRGERYAVASPE